MGSLKYKIEALLFSSARRMALEELESLTKAAPEDIRASIQELISDYQKRSSSIHIRDEGNAWKLTVKDEHLDAVKQIVTKTELSKTLLETLAVIAFKYPIKQSDLIKIRTNKAYDHLNELEDLEYIIRQKYGRTKLIRLTPKFFEYFDLPPERLKEQFKDFKGIAMAIEEKEGEIKKLRQEQRSSKAEEIHATQQEGQENKEDQKGQKGQKEVDLIGEKGQKIKLDTFEEPDSETEESKEVEVIEEKVGGLEVVDVPPEEDKPKYEEPLETEPAETTEEGTIEEGATEESTEEEATEEAHLEENLGQEEENNPEEEKESEVPSDNLSIEEDKPGEIDEDAPKKIDDVDTFSGEEPEHIEPKKKPKDLLGE